MQLACAAPATAARLQPEQQQQQQQTPLQCLRWRLQLGLLGLPPLAGQAAMQDKRYKSECYGVMLARSG
jgi:hypothetical protein